MACIARARHDGLHAYCNARADRDVPRTRHTPTARARHVARGRRIRGSPSRRTRDGRKPQPDPETTSAGVQERTTGARTTTCDRGRPRRAARHLPRVPPVARPAPVRPGRARGRPSGGARQPQPARRGSTARGRGGTGRRSWADIARKSVCRPTTSARWGDIVVMTSRFFVTISHSAAPSCSRTEGGTTDLMRSCSTTRRLGLVADPASTARSSSTDARSTLMAASVTSLIGPSSSSCDPSVCFLFPTSDLSASAATSPPDGRPPSPAAVDSGARTLERRSDDSTRTGSVCM